MKSVTTLLGSLLQGSWLSIIERTSGALKTIRQWLITTLSGNKSKKKYFLSHPHLTVIIKRNNMPKIKVRGSSSSGSSSSVGASRMMLIPEDVVEVNPVLVVIEENGDVEIYTGKEATEALKADTKQEK